MNTHNNMETIGKVCLDYRYYSGKDTYTDGPIEHQILEASKNGTCEDLLYISNHWAVLYHLSDIRENLLEWYPFTKNDKVLEVGAGCGAITGVLSRKAGHVTCIELSKQRSLINAYRHKECENIEIFVGNFQDIEPHMEKFDYITLVGVWEYSGMYIDGENPYLEMLLIAKKHLNPEGKIIIAIENKMGLKYWNGAVEDHTSNLYSGLNDYIYDNNRKVRTFSKIEVEELLQEADIENHTFYYPMPDYKLPDVIYHDDALPHPGAERNFGKDYSAIRMYHFNDAVVSDQLCADGMFPYFANSFLIIAGASEDVQIYAKYNRTRKEQFQTKIEILTRNHTKVVKKSAINKNAGNHIINLKECESGWSKNPLRIKQAIGNLQNGEYVVPYIEGVDLDTTFYKYRNDVKKFKELFLYYTEEYFSADEQHFKPFHISEEFISIFGDQYPSDKTSLKYTNADTTFTNLRLTPEKELYSIDSEWVFGFPIPFEFVIWRNAAYLYNEYSAYLKNQITKTDFLIEIGISEKNIKIYENMESHFGNFVYGTKRYLNNYRKNIILQNNRFL